MMGLLDKMVCLTPVEIAVFGAATEERQLDRLLFYVH